MKNLNAAIKSAVAAAQEVYTLEECLSDAAQVDISLADHWVSLDGKRLDKRFLDYMEACPEAGEDYLLLAVLRHDGQTLFITDLSAEEAEDFAHGSLYMTEFWD